MGDISDDLDELLDEVETKFCRDVAVTFSARRDSGEDGSCCEDKRGEHGRQRAAQSEPVDGGLSEDIDALLQELLEDDLSRSRLAKTEPAAKGQHEEKRLPLQPGGRKLCDQLRCTSCDFRVLMFDDSEWDSSCDYLFFRNNMPDRQKLAARLRRRRGCRAYACQCSWLSAAEATELRDRAQIRWVCGRHQV